MAEVMDMKGIGKVPGVRPVGWDSALRVLSITNGGSLLPREPLEPLFLRRVNY